MRILKTWSRIWFCVIVLCAVGCSPLLARAQEELPFFTDDFTDGQLQDGVPVKWREPEAWGLPLLMPTGDIVDGEYVLTPAADNSTYASPDGLVLEDFSIRTQVRSVEPTNSFGFHLVFGRQDPQSRNANLYWGGIGTDGLLATGRVVNNNIQIRRRMRMPYNVNEDQVNLQLDVFGNTISLTAWPDGEDKPDEPILEFEDELFTQGYVGLEMNPSADLVPAAFQYFSVLPTAKTPLPPRLRPLRPGDADMDLDFDQLDLVQIQVAGKYLTGEAATWGEGDWDGGPGGNQTKPPIGDGKFDQLDIVAAQQMGIYLSGKYASHSPHGETTSGTRIALNLENSYIDRFSELTLQAGTRDDQRFEVFDDVSETGPSVPLSLNTLTSIGPIPKADESRHVEMLVVPEPSSQFSIVIAAILLVTHPWLRCRVLRHGFS